MFMSSRAESGPYRQYVRKRLQIKLNILVWTARPLNFNSIFNLCDWAEYDMKNFILQFEEGVIITLSEICIP